MLASHYLRTPISIMIAATDLLKDNGAFKPKQAEAVEESINRLGQKTEVILKEVEGNTYLKEIIAPDIRKESLKRLTSTYIWLPLVFILGIVAIGHYLFVNVHQLTVPFINYAIEALIFIIIAVFYIFALRRLYTEKQKTQKSRQELEREIILDEARNEFILDIDRELRTSLDSVKHAFTHIRGDQKESVTEAIGRLEDIFTKIHAITSLKAGRIERHLQEVSLGKIVGTSLKLNKKTISEKSLKVDNKVGDTTVRTDNDKLRTVIDTVIGNAAKFNHPSGKIEITEHGGIKETVLTIKDTGIGISPEKKDLIFRPLGRATSALDFNYEGMGLSLYLAKVIMTYLNGRIDLESNKSGTTVNIRVSEPI